MTLGEVLFHLDEVYNTQAMKPEVRFAAQHAFRMLVAFKCARQLTDDLPAHRLSVEAWATDESSRREDVPTHQISGHI